MLLGLFLFWQIKGIVEGLASQENRIIMVLGLRLLSNSKCAQHRVAPDALRFPATGSIRPV